VATTVHEFHFENVLGTSLDMKVRAGSEADAERAQAAALAEFDRENKILSAWTPDSEFSRWAKTRGTAERVSPELFEVLALFDEWREKTGGALDASAEAAVAVWKKAAAEGRKPTDAELEQAVAEMMRRTNEGQCCGIVFGPERNGLETEEIANADALVMAPVNPNFASLNLARACCWSATNG